MDTACTVVARDERRPGTTPHIDLERWAELAERAATAEGGAGELTLTFVDVAAMAELNTQHMGVEGPTDVLAFPMDDDPMPGVPLLLGDVVVCPEVAQRQSADHAGNLGDELALLVVHGVLHVLGHDHAETDEAATMRAREMHLLERLHWHGAAPAEFRRAQD